MRALFNTCRIIEQHADRCSPRALAPQMHPAMIAPRAVPKNDLHKVDTAAIVSIRSRRAISPERGHHHLLSKRAVILALVEVRS